MVVINDHREDRPLFSDQFLRLKPAIKINIAKYTIFRSLDISANKLSRYPPELQLLKNLKVLNVSNNRLTEINVAKLTKLESIICRSNLILQFPNVSLCRNLKTVRYFTPFAKDFDMNKLFF